MLIDGNPKNNPSQIAFQSLSGLPSIVCSQFFLWNTYGMLMADQRLGLETSGRVGTSRREKMEWNQVGWELGDFTPCTCMMPWMNKTSDWPSLLISRTIEVTITTNNMVRAASSTGTICRWKNANFGPTSQHRLATTCNYIISFEVCVCIYNIYILYI